MSEMLEAALLYEAHGLAVVPWRARADGQKVTTRDWKLGVVPRMSEADIRTWWRINPTHNVGLLTGRPSDVVILDADSDEAVARLLRDFPVTPWVIKSKRGKAFGYRAPRLAEGQGLKTDAHLGCKLKSSLSKARPWTPQDHKNCDFGGDFCLLDIRADKGFYAMPPSIHPSGIAYEWVTEAESLQEILDGLPLFDLSWFPQLVKESRVTAPLPSLDWETRDAGGDFAAARNWMNLQPPAISGQFGRNQTFKVAAGLCRDFGLTLSQSWDLLCVYNQRCIPPWDEDALRGKLEDAWQKGTHQIGSYKVDKAPSPLEVLGRAVQPEAPAAQSPADEEPKPATKLSVDEEFVLRLPAETARQPSAPFLQENITTAARIYRDSPHLYHELAQALKDLKIVDMQDWKRRLRAAVKEAKGAHKVLRNDDRKEVVVNADPKQVRDDILEVLKTCPGVFVTAGKLSYVDGTAAMVELKGGTLRNFIVNNCQTVSVTEEGIHKPASVPAETLQMLEDMLPEMLAQFRHVRQVTRSPFFTRSGQLVCEPGYNAESQILLVDCPAVDLSWFQSAEDAIGYIYNFFHEFDFQSFDEFINYLGAMLTPMVRPMFTGAVMWLMIEANVMASGKTLLADLLQILYGYKPNHEELPFREEEIAKTMLTILPKMTPVVIFDNVKHVIDSSTLEAVATADGDHQGRVLGKSESRTCPVLQLFVCTANNCTTSPDFSRRFLRVRLRKQSAVTATSGTKKRFEVSDPRRYMQEHRGYFLAALAWLVRDWISAGRPVPDTVPIFPSFEAFCENVGAVMHHAGRTDWGSNWEEAKRAFSVNDDWRPFFSVWWDTYKSKPQNPNILLSLANNHGLLAGVTAKHTETSAKLAAFRKRLNELRDFIDEEFRVCVSAADRSQPVYWLEKIEKVQEVAA